jgi:hypothetical protein
MSRYQNVILKGREKAFNKGLCIDCWKDKESNRKEKQRCLSCSTNYNNKLKNKFAERNKENQCWACGNKSTLKNNLNFFSGKKRKWLVCEKCFFKEASKKHLGTQKKWQELKNLLEIQKNKCYISGRKLIIGKNASIDHINPRSLGGKDSIENIAWCDTQINLIKNKLSLKEFYKLCEEVVSNKKIL